MGISDRSECQKRNRYRSNLLFSRIKKQAAEWIKLILVYFWKEKVGAGGGVDKGGEKIQQPNLKRLLPSQLPVTYCVREITAIPVAIDLLRERGYCYLSCQRLAVWERLLPSFLPSNFCLTHTHTHTHTHASCRKVATVITDELGLFRNSFERWYAMRLLLRSCLNILPLFGL